MSQDNSQTNTESAPDVKVRFQLDLNAVELKDNQIKCSTCKTVTPHQWFMVQVHPTPGTVVDPMDLIAMARRALMCQNCGNMRLIK